MYERIIYGIIILCAILSVLSIGTVRKGKNKLFSYIDITPFYDMIPNVFITLGVLGTFLGIFLGLQDFDVDNITESIPTLLEGLKTAFLTSIFGISLSFLFSFFIQKVRPSAESDSHSKPMDELTALQQINATLVESRKESDTNLQTLNKSLIGETDDSISTQLVKIRNQFADLEKKQDKQNNTMLKVQQALGGDSETSLLTQIQKFRAEQIDAAKETKKLLSEKFDEFSKLLAKNNTEALVEVMESATEEFNKQMSTLIDKLVKENFKELNTSVQRMNDWQQENKNMITQLTDQFKTVSGEFQITSGAIKEITDNTNKLTNDNSHLKKLIEALQKVMIDDTKYQEIVNKLISAVNTLEGNTNAFDRTTHKLNDWVKNQMNFSSSVATLLERLEEIGKIKDINEVFWKNTEKQLNEGVNMIARANKSLSNDIEEIDQVFYDRLNKTLQNLDGLIRSIVENNESKVKNR